MLLEELWDGLSLDPGGGPPHFFGIEVGVGWLKDFDDFGGARVWKVVPCAQESTECMFAAECGDGMRGDAFECDCLLGGELGALVDDVE
jgi:hypothetical protein